MSRFKDGDRVLLEKLEKSSHIGYGQEEVEIEGETTEMMRKKDFVYGELHRDVEISLRRNAERDRFEDGELQRDDNVRD